MNVLHPLGCALEPFRKSIILGGDSLFCELEEDLQEVPAQGQRTQRRRILHSELCGGLLARLELHTRAEEERMSMGVKQGDAYDGTRGDHRRIVNLQQAPERATPGQLVLVLQTKGHICPFRKKRCLTANVHLGVMGIDVITPTPEDTSMSKLFHGASTMGPADVLKCLAGISDNDKFHLAGNTLHQCCAGIVLARFLSIMGRNLSVSSDSNTYGEDVLSSD